MKIKARHWTNVAAAVILGLLAGCSKAPSGKAGRNLGKLAGSPSDPPVELKLKWASSPDAHRMMKMDINRHVRRIPRGRTELVDHEFNFSQDCRLTVTNAGEAKLGLDMELLSLETSTSVGDNFTQRFDSDGQAETATENSIGDFLKKSIGGHIYYLLGARGEVEQVKGARELLQRMGATTGAMAAAVRRIYNPEYFKEILELCTLPENPVRINESWPFKRDAAVASAPMVAEGNCRFKGWQDHESHKCAVIEVAGTLQSRATPPPMRLRQGASNQVSFVSFDTPRGLTPSTSNQFQRSAVVVSSPPAIEDGKISGVIWFDPELGLPIETSLEESYSAKVMVVPRKNQTNVVAKTYSSPISQKISLKLVESEPQAK